MWCLYLVLAGIIPSLRSECVQSVTTASGPKAPLTPVCSGDLIFEDNFNNFDLNTWLHQTEDISRHFHDYVNDSDISFVKDGYLYMKPTPNPATYVESKKTRPVRSSRISTKKSFTFKYGRVEVRAKIPGGDWIHPGIWLTPPLKYGPWPRSGEIDIMEARCNEGLFEHGTNGGSEQVGYALHYGLGEKLRKMFHKPFNSPKGQGFNKAFHRYQMLWSPSNFTFLVDDKVLGVEPHGESWFKRAGFKKGTENIWAKGSPMAPFDEEFFLIFSMAIGGVKYFSDSAKNMHGKKPWNNGDIKNAQMNFWRGREQWLPTWQNGNSAMLVDYVRVWAL